MHGLLIKAEFLERMFAGRKDWEIRGSRTAVRGLVALIESGSGTVVGTAVVKGVEGPLTLRALRANARRAGCPPSDFRRKPYRRTFAWVLDDFRRLRRPVPYTHPPGAVIWVKLSSRIARQVA